MGGKIALATALVVPFKEKIGEAVPPETGELRIQQHGSSNNSAHGSSTTSNHDNSKPSSGGAGGSEAAPTTRGVPGGAGHGSAGLSLPAPGDSGGLSVEAIMAAVGTCVGDNDEGYDEMESAHGGAEARGNRGNTKGRDGDEGSSGGGVGGSNVGGSSSSRRLQRVEEEREEREQGNADGAHRLGKGGGDIAVGVSGGSSLGCKEDEDGSWESRAEGKEEEGCYSTSSGQEDEKEEDVAPSHEGGGHNARTRGQA